MGKLTPGKSRGTKGSTVGTGLGSRGGKGNQSGKVTSIKSFFEAKAGGLTSNLGTRRKEDRRTDSPEPALGPEPGKEKDNRNQLE